MLRTFGFSVIRQCNAFVRNGFVGSRSLSSTVGTSEDVISSSEASSEEYDIDDRAFLHHGIRPRFREKPKFKSPRKRASSLYKELQEEAIEQSKKSRPKVWNTKFNVGDAIEIEAVTQGGVKSDDTEKLRGVVLGIFRKGLDHSVLLRDVVFGEPIERRIPLHSPLVRSVRLIEENFIFKGKRRVKRAKLYYLRDRNPQSTYILKNVT